MHYFTRAQVSSSLTNYRATLSPGQESLFDEAIGALDENFAPPLLFNSPRYSAWYAVGLLARNEGNDVRVASDLIRNAISFQFKDPSMLWFGTFKNDPNAPDPGDLFPPKIYDSYDPNNALFVCTSWIIVMEEFQHMLDPSLIRLMKESMYNATIGDGYRVGGIDGDNLYTIYSNPWYMRVMSATYVGHMMSDKNMTMWGNVWAQEAIEEFEKFNTISEFNSGTYAGVTLYALSLYGYMPGDSVIANAAPMIIKNKQYFAILGAQITGLIRAVGKTDAGGCEPIPSPLIGSEHFSDVAATVLTTILSKFHDPLVPESARSSLTQTPLGTPHFTRAQASSPPFDNPLFPRNYTSWNEEGLSVGGIEFDMAFVGGASVNPEQFTPAAILWSTGVSGRSVGWITHHLSRQHYATSSSVSALASPHNLTISYRASRAFPDSFVQSSTITLLISGIPGHPLRPDFGHIRDDAQVTEMPGLKVKFSGTRHLKDANPMLKYGEGSLNGLIYYNLTYVLVQGNEATGDPELVLEFQKT
ncbi:hypothetical protein NP233_g3898 [Leucocoprinus birnbaumii]|uniref:Uncharacterized protein n=1 Tax=Leucocoprinus birnbaumii TaxID=56174 RepID=A0AAD5VVR1_9AGAR|nr:hypothetical protein NP233_g3898 [Leucocoprinus birnbaumii]